MIESISYRLCIWDDLPIEESAIYQTLLHENGVKFANRHSKQIIIDLHPPPEVTHVETARNHTNPLGTAG